MNSNLQSIIIQTYKIGVIAICFIVLSKVVAGQTDDRMNQMVQEKHHQYMAGYGIQYRRITILCFGLFLQRYKYTHSQWFNQSILYRVPCARCNRHRF